MIGERQCRHRYDWESQAATAATKIILHLYIVYIETLRQNPCKKLPKEKICKKKKNIVVKPIDPSLHTESKKSVIYKIFKHNKYMISRIDE